MTGTTVWLASYPKSGNTWFRAVFHAWKRDDEVELNALGGGAIASGRDRFDDALGIPSSDLTADEIDALRPRADEVRSDGVRDHSGEPDLRKIHDALFMGPADELIISVPATRAAIYFIRDPRDVALSYSHHMGDAIELTVARLGNPESSVGGTSPRRLHHQLRQRMGTWSEHVESWVDQTHFPVHVVRYEDAHTDPVGVFGAALRFAGFDVADADVARAVERASFDRLQAHEAEEGFRERPSISRQFFRRGVAGSWMDELDPDLAKRIEREHAVVMQRFGYAAPA